MPEPGRAAKGRILALDYGRRRIGVAVSDPTRTIATPTTVVRNASGGPEPPAELLRVIEEAAPVEILLGIPLRMDGSEGEMAREVRRFARALGARAGLPIVEWDERMSSREAERTLIDAGVPRRKRRDKGRHDMAAAALLLRSYLAAEASATGGSGSAGMEGPGGTGTDHGGPARPEGPAGGGTEGGS